MEGQSQSTEDQPDGSIKQFVEACAGGQQRHGGEAEHVGQLFLAADTADGRHAGEDADEGAQDDSPGAAVQEAEDAVAHETAHILGDGGAGQAKAQQEDQTGEVSGSSLGNELFAVDAGLALEIRGVSLGELVELFQNGGSPQQESDPHRVVQVINDDAGAHVTLRHVQNGLDGDHVVGTADPAADQGGCGVGGVVAQHIVEHRIGDHDAGTDSQCGAQEGDDQLGSQLCQLTDVAADQHQGNHGVQQVVLHRCICRISCIQVPEVEGAAQHVQHINEHECGEPFPDLPGSLLFQHTDNARNGYAGCDVIKASSNHILSPFLFHRTWGEGSVDRGVSAFLPLHRQRAGAFVPLQDSFYQVSFFS